MLAKELLNEPLKVFKGRQKIIWIMLNKACQIMP